MKRIILILLFLLISSPAFAVDYWVFIRMEDRPGVTDSDDAGRSKKGDVVHIAEAVPGQEPTLTEKQEYSIIVVSDLTQQDIDELLEKFVDVDYVKSDPLEPDKYVAMRLRKVDVDVLGNVKGYDSVPKNKNDFKSKVKLKNKKDIVRYKINRAIYANLIRPTKIVGNIITRRAFAAQQISKICAVGSGCTDENYNSLVTWEDTEDGDLVTDARQETAEVYDNDGDLTANVTIDGSTTNSTNYMEITCPTGERHNGTHSGGGCELNASGNQNILANDSYTRISWIILSGQTGTGFLHVALEYSTATNGTFDHIVYNNPAGGCAGAWITDTAAHRSSMCVSPGTSGYYSNQAGGTQPLHDVTIYGAGTKGVDGSSYDCDNVAIFSSTTTDNGGCVAGHTTVATSDTTGSTGLQSLTASNQFVSLTGGSEDLHLKSGADLISAGSTPTGGPYNDIDNTTRPDGTYDIGADEYIAAAASTRRKSIVF